MAATSEHHLTGLCEGIILRRNGREVTTHYPNHTEPTVSTFEDEVRADAFMWRLRDSLYRDAEVKAQMPEVRP